MTNPSPTKYPYITAHLAPQAQRWPGAIAAWLEHHRDRSAHTHAAYRLAAARFFAWAAWYTGAPVHPGQIAPELTTQYAAWLRREGKAVQRDPDTRGRAPWERDSFDPAAAPTWIRWEDTAGNVYLRRNGHYGDDHAPTVEARGPLATASVNLKIAAMRSLYDFVSARYNGLWPADRANPFDPNLIERQAAPRRRAIYPTVDELKQALAAINRECVTGARDFALIFAFAQTCRRFSELINLRWGDIDHDPILEGPNAGDYAYRFDVAKKRREEQHIDVLNARVYDAICHYLALAGRLDRRAGLEPAPDEYVWIPIFEDRIERIQPDADADELARMATTPLANPTVNAILKKRARMAGLDEDKFHVHGLRHAGARLRYRQMRRRGEVDPQVLQVTLCHQNLNTTMTYIRDNLETPRDPGGREAARELLEIGEIL